MSVALLLVLAFAGVVAWKGPRTLHEALHPRLYTSDEFPEDLFPARDPEAFGRRVAAGYAAMKGLSAVFCGLSQDNASTLPLTIRRIERTGRLFRDYRVAVFENDSTDDTLERLRRWESANSRVTVLSESLAGRPMDLAAWTERLAYCRNRYLEWLRNDPASAGFDHVIVLDFDLGGGWSYDGLASSFAARDWDGVASNSVGFHYMRKTYYDTFALRPRSLVDAGLLHRLIGEGHRFRRDDPLIPVRSAFGGLAIYRRAALIARSYAGVLDGKPVCEHVPLHLQAEGLALYLNPAQVTVVGTQDAKFVSQRTRYLRSLLLNW